MDGLVAQGLLTIPEQVAAVGESWGVALALTHPGFPVDKSGSLIIGAKDDLNAPKSMFFSESPQGRSRIDARLKARLAHGQFKAQEIAEVRKAVFYFSIPVVGGWNGSENAPAGISVQAIGSSS